MAEGAEGEGALRGSRFSDPTVAAEFIETSVLTVLKDQAAGISPSSLQYATVLAAALGAALDLRVDPN